MEFYRDCITFCWPAQTAAECGHTDTERHWLAGREFCRACATSYRAGVYDTQDRRALPPDGPSIGPDVPGGGAI